MRDHSRDSRDFSNFLAFFFILVLIQQCALLSRSRQKQRQDRALLDTKVVVTKPAVVRAIERQSRFQRVNIAFDSESSLSLAAVDSISLEVRVTVSGKLDRTSGRFRFKCEPSCRIGAR